jgi:hypothetical protein
MNELVIEQAVYGSEGAGGYRFLARSVGFRDDWVPAAQRLCTVFGERPAGVACPACVFAQPFGPQHVAVVQVADHGRDDAGRPGTLRFRLLIVPRKLYAALEGDPFLIADTYPSPEQADGLLPVLTWTAGPPPRRTVEMLQKVLNVPHSATLLGSAQALIDGGRVVLTRSQPDAKVLRSLWALLPSSSRGELWPATFAFGNVSAFHAVAVPAALAPSDPVWIHEEQAGDYPEGRYELGLQIAVESGNQRDLDALLARKTRVQMIQIAAAILAALLGILLVPMAISMLGGAPVATTHAPAAAPVALKLPPENECPPLRDDERRKLEAALQELAKHRDIELPRGTTDQELTETLARLDDKLGTPATPRDPGPLRNLGAIQRQVRALLWKHGVAGYNERGPNTAELVERLANHPVKERRP